MKKFSDTTQALLDATESIALQKMLEEATEHHCLTVVRMALRDIKGGSGLQSALLRLWSDLDKMHCSRTLAGQKLHDYLTRKWKEHSDAQQESESRDDD